MKLQEFRKEKGLSVVEAARQNLVSKVTWGNWEALRKRPSERNYARLLKWTRGRVTPNDFYDLPYHHYKPHKVK